MERTPKFAVKIGDFLAHFAQSSQKAEVSLAGDFNLNDHQVSDYPPRLISKPGTRIKGHAPKT